VVGNTGRRVYREGSARGRDQHTDAGGGFSLRGQLRAGRGHQGLCSGAAG
jgi:hypothetical protein